MLLMLCRALLAAAALSSPGTLVMLPREEATRLTVLSSRATAALEAIAAKAAEEVPAGMGTTVTAPLLLREMLGPEEEPPEPEEPEEPEELEPESTRAESSQQDLVIGGDLEGGRGTRGATGGA